MRGWSTTRRTPSSRSGPGEKSGGCPRCGTWRAASSWCWRRCVQEARPPGAVHMHSCSPRHTGRHREAPCALGSRVPAAVSSLCSPARAPGGPACWSDRAEVGGSPRRPGVARRSEASQQVPRRRPPGRRRGLRAVVGAAERSRRGGAWERRGRCGSWRKQRPLKVGGASRAGGLDPDVAAVLAQEVVLGGVAEARLAVLGEGLPAQGGLEPVVKLQALGGCDVW